MPARINRNRRTRGRTAHFWGAVRTFRERILLSRAHWGKWKGYPEYSQRFLQSYSRLFSYGEGRTRSSQETPQKNQIYRMAGASIALQDATGGCENCLRDTRRLLRYSY